MYRTSISYVKWMTIGLFIIMLILALAEYGFFSYLLNTLFDQTLDSLKVM